MAGVVALIVAFLAFAVPLALPLFVQRWWSFAILAGLATGFFLWVNFDIGQAAANGGDGVVGAFLGGLMLIGFAAGAIAKFVMLLGRGRNPSR